MISELGFVLVLVPKQYIFLSDIRGNRKNETEYTDQMKLQYSGNFFIIKYSKHADLKWNFLNMFCR